jgi:hypothetical protein
MGNASGGEDASRAGARLPKACKANGGRGADAMHALLVRRADDPTNSNGGDAAEPVAIVDAIEAYEAKRWPLGKRPGGKG